MSLKGKRVHRVVAKINAENVKKGLTIARHKLSSYVLKILTQTAEGMLLSRTKNLPIRAHTKTSGFFAILDTDFAEVTIGNITGFHFRVSLILNDVRNDKGFELDLVIELGSVSVTAKTEVTPGFATNIALKFVGPLSHTDDLSGDTSFAGGNQNN
jgi:hypothetical protein